jgi:hypothetical protein
MSPGMTRLSNVAFAFLVVQAMRPEPGSAQSPIREPVTTTTKFQFYSDFKTNLNDALVNQGEARRRKQPELFKSGAEVACFEKLPGETQSGWNRAVDYYADSIAPGGWTGRQQYALRLYLAGFRDDVRDANDRRFLVVADSVMAAARAAYETCRWRVQDEKNRAWITALRPPLVRHEARISSGLERAFADTLDLPLRVDVVETVSWSGANSTFLDGAGSHLLVSAAYQGTDALEIVFHESSHGLMMRTDSLRRALESAARDQAVTAGDLWHVLLFYTTGDVVRRVLREAGEPEHRLILYGIYDRGTWTEFRRPLETSWQPYLDGKTSLAAALNDLVRAIRKE